SQQYYYQPPPSYYRNDTAVGAVAGGGVGALTGALIGGKKNGEGGALIGAGVGALTGGLIGKSVDNADRRHAAAGVAVAHQANAQVAAAAVTNFDLVEMTRAGVSEELIISTIRSRGGRFDLSPSALISLKQQGAGGGCGTAGVLRAAGACVLLSPGADDALGLPLRRRVPPPWPSPPSRALVRLVKTSSTRDARVINCGV
ncbi:MAG TPA: YMGG-like glycine zipper-containing protein, partial [Lacipirellulaceae bacterium]|nr:YMGG-like glycine zipper-containing protein [Lacipirellulaceae bacterium]